MTSSNEIGKVKITVEADTDNAREGLKGVVADAKNAGEEADRSASKMNRAFSGVGETLEKVQSSLGKILIPAAVLGTISAMVVKLQAARSESKAFLEGLEDAADQMEVLRSDLLRDKAGILDPETESIEAIYKRSIELQQQINKELDGEIERRRAARQASSTTAFFKELASGKTADELAAEAAKQIARIDKATTEAVIARRQLNDRNSKRDAERRIEEDAERLEKFTSQLSQLLSSQEIDILPDDEKIKANADRQKSALIEAAEDANVKIEDKKLQTVLANIDAAADRQIQKNADIERAKQEEQDRRAKESADRQAKAIASALERELASVTQALFGTGGNNITTNMQTIVKELKEVSNAIGRR